MVTWFWQSPLILHWVLNNPSPQEGAVGPSLLSEASRLVQHSIPFCSYAMTMPLTSGLGPGPKQASRQEHLCPGREKQESTRVLPCCVLEYLPGPQPQLCLL